MERFEVESGQELNFFLKRFNIWKGWLASYVVDQFGEFKGSDGTSGTIGNQLDLKMLIALRSIADVIVTTGATARAEQYKASRFAPIAFVTNNPEALTQLPAFTKPGEYENLVFSDLPTGLEIQSIETDFQAKAFEAFLYEGGPAFLQHILQSSQPVGVVLNIANLKDPESVDPRDYLFRLLPGGLDAVLQDDFIVGQNRVTRWLIRA